MTTEIPTTLVRELAARRCLIFVGAGLSMQSKGADGVTRTPSWGDLLSRLLPLSQPDDRTRSETLITERRYLDAAEVIMEGHNPAEFDRITREVFVDPKFQPSSCHKAILKIDPKIVVTTNYDTLIENEYTAAGVDHVACRQYEDHALNVVRSDRRLILKAHGCVSNTRRIVLTRSSYFEARNENHRFYALLDALFLVHTVLFVGYSLQDPDIQLVLENAQIRSPSDHPHYMLMPSGTDMAILRAMTRSYNFHPLLYDNASGTHQECEVFLEALANAVESERA
jgi:hypothetical protein